MKTPKKLINTVNQYKNGNEDVFGSIYELSYKKLYTCMLHIVGDEDVANNLLQDTYDELKEDSSIFKASWEFMNIASALGNKACCNYLKAEKKEDFAEEAKQSASDVSVKDNERFLSDKLLQDKEKIEKIHDAIDGLNTFQRLCVIAFYYTEQKVDDIAKMLDVSADDVKAAINVFIAKLKETVGDASGNKNAKLYAPDQFMHQFVTKDVETFTEELAIPAIGTRVSTAKKEPEQAEQPKTAEKKKTKKATKKEAKKAEAVKQAEAKIQKTEKAEQTGQTEVEVENSKSDDINKSEEPKPEKSDKTKKDDDAKETKDEPTKTSKTSEKSSGTKLNIIIALCAACVGFFAGVLFMNYRISSSRTPAQSEPTANAETSGAQTLDEQPEEEPEPEEVVFITEITGLDKYDEYGRAYGGIIPVSKDGKFGAINYEGKEVVPCKYESCFSSADDSGSFILADGDVKKVFDSNGKLVYEGADDVRVSGGMFITLEYNDTDYSAKTVFHKMDGTEVLSVPCEYGISHINVFYDGICTVQKKAEEEEGKNDDEISPMIGNVTTDGKVTWRPDESYLLNSVISTENHGYYVCHDPIVAPTILNLYDSKGELVSSLDFGYLAPDDEKGFTVSDTVHEENMYYGFWSNGGYTYNYGSKMLLGIGDKKVLIDFAKSPGMELDTMSNDIVTAVYDEILLADENYWLVSRDGKWGFIDHDGKEMKMYDDACAFSHGKAFVVENGEAYLIDENFEKIQDMGKADRVSLRGELLYIEQNGKPHVYLVNE